MFILSKHFVISLKRINVLISHKMTENKKLKNININDTSPYDLDSLTNINGIISKNIK